jgi:hypothetical protein
MDASAEPDVVQQQEAAVEEEASSVMDAKDAQDEQPAPPPTCTAQSCGGACCGGRCVSQTCAGCDAGTHFCPFNSTVASSNGSCVGDCSNCQIGATVLGTTCFDCSLGAPAAQCVGSASSCPGTLNAGACACASGDAGECPGSTQVCQGSDGGDFTCLTP